jgi:hypothetical protein
MKEMALCASLYNIINDKELMIGLISYDDTFICINCSDKIYINVSFDSKYSNKLKDNIKIYELGEIYFHKVYLNINGKLCQEFEMTDDDKTPFIIKFEYDAQRQAVIAFIEMISKDVIKLYIESISNIDMKFAGRKV